jgi:hypothetical protein
MSRLQTHCHRDNRDERDATCEEQPVNGFEPEK